MGGATGVKGVPGEKRLGIGLSDCPLGKDGGPVGTTAGSVYGFGPGGPVGTIGGGV